MENFTYHNPTKVHFGKGVVEQHLEEALQSYGNRILLLTGRGSVLRNGVYDELTGLMKRAGIEFTEYSGIKSNPLAEDVDRVVEKINENKSQLILAAGGGSVVDSAKFAAMCAPGKLKATDLLRHKAEPLDVLPVICVLTLAATGTEMNGAAVIQDHSVNYKGGYVHPRAYPKVSFLDPAYTQSVPADYTAYGITDLIVHALEAFFGEGKAELSDRFVFSIIKEAMEIGPKLMQNLNDYDLRARLMWAATTALNGWTNCGRKYGDWGMHNVSHNISLLFDVPHGAALSIVAPAWMKLHKNRLPERLRLLGRELFGQDSAQAAIDGFTEFFLSIKSPVKLSEVDIGQAEKMKLLQTITQNKATGMVHSLTTDDYQVMVGDMLA